MTYIIVTCLSIIIPCQNDLFEFLLNNPMSPTDIASFANDAINFTQRRRKLMESLKSSGTFLC